MRVLWYSKRWREIPGDREVIYTSSNRLRAYNFHEAVRRLPGFESEVAGYTIADPDPSEFDAVVYQKVLDRKRAFLLRQSGVVVVLDACDPLKLPPGLPLCLSAIAVSSHELAAVFEKGRPGIPVEVIEDAHEANPDRVRRHEAAPKLVATTYGTPDTVAWSVRFLQPVLERLPWLDFRCSAGSNTVSGLWDGIRPYNRPEVQFHMDWREAWKRPDSWQEFIFQSDVGLVPPAEPRPRSHHKALNYMAYGIPVVCQATDANRRIIRDGENGFFAETPEEWIRALERLRDPELRNRLGAKAREAVAEAFRVEAVGQRYAQWLLRLQAEARAHEGRIQRAWQKLGRAALRAV